MEGLGFGFTVSLNDLFSNPLENMINKFKKLEGVSQDVVKKVERQFDNFNIGQNLAIGGALLASPLVVATSAAMDFEAQLSSIKAVAGEGIDMSAIKKTALDAGSQTAFSALEAAKGMEELIKAGIDATTVINGGLVPALNLATAGELSVAEAAEIASTGVNAFGLEKSAASIERVGNALSGAANASATNVREMKFAMSAVATVAAGMNFTFEDTSLALGVLAKNTLIGSDAGTSLKVMLQNLQPDTKESIKLFKELGIITKDNKNQFLTAEGGFKSMGEIAQVLQDKLKHLTVAARADALKQMFGTDAVRAANIFFKQGAAGFDAMREASKQSTMESIAAEKLNNLKGSLEMFKGAFETFLINVGLQLTPIFKNLVDFVTPAVNLFNDFAQTTVGQTVIKITAAISGLLIVLGLGIMAQSAFNIVSLTAVPILKSWATNLGIATIAQKIWNLVTLVSVPILNSIASSLGLVTTSMRAFVISALPIVGVLAIIGAAVTLLVKSWQSFTDLMNGGEKATGFLGFMQTLGGFMQGVVQVFETANSEGFSIPESMHKGLEKLGILDTIIAIGTYAVRIKEIINGFFGVFKNITLDPIKNAFSRLFAAFKFDVILEKLQPVFNGIGKILSGFTAFASIFTSIDVGLANNTSSLEIWKNIGWFAGNIIFGVFMSIITTIENMINWVIFAVNIFTTLIGAFFNLGAATIDLFSKWWNGAITTQELFIDLGDNIRNFFSEVFSGIFQSFLTLIDNIKNSIANLPFGEKILNLFGVNTAKMPSMLAVPTNQFAIGNTLESQRGGIVTPNDQLLSNSTAAVLKNQTIRNEFYQNNLTPTAPIVNVQGNNQPTEVIVELDGDRVGKAVINRINENGARQ